MRNRMINGNFKKFVLAFSITTFLLVTEAYAGTISNTVFTSSKNSESINNELKLNKANVYYLDSIDELSKSEKTLDYWKDFNINTPDIVYTKSSIDIRTSEYLLDTIKSLEDSKMLAKKVIAGFNDQNGFAYPRTLYSVQLEIYFHIQSEKWARIHNNLDTHKHTAIINMGVNEIYIWNFFNTEEKINNLAAGENISEKYSVFISNYRKKLVPKVSLALP